MAHSEMATAGADDNSDALILDLTKERTETSSSTSSPSSEGDPDDQASDAEQSYKPPRAERSVSPAADSVASRSVRALRSSASQTIRDAGHAASKLIFHLAAPLFRS